MKIRTDFVTNSSSSSFVAVSLIGGEVSAEFSCREEALDPPRWVFEGGIESLESAKDVQSAADALFKLLSWEGRYIDDDLVAHLEEERAKVVDAVASASSVEAIGRLVAECSYGDDYGEEGARLLFDFKAGRGSYDPWSQVCLDEDDEWDDD